MVQIVLPPDRERARDSAATDELGVLLVHGIGDQKQGETLNEFGAPIIKWIDQWLGSDLRINRLVANLAQLLGNQWTARRRAPVFSQSSRWPALMKQ